MYFVKASTVKRRVMTKVKNISIQSLINQVLARGFSGVVSKSLGASAVGAMMK